MLYCIVFLLLIFLSAKYELFSTRKSINTQWLPIIFLIFVAIAGFRDGLGVDTIQYENFFRKIPYFSDLKDNFYETTRFRPGFVILMSLCKSIVDDFVFFQFVEAIFVNGVIVYFIKKRSAYPYLSLLLYFLINYLEFNMEIQREAISVCLVLLSWDFWERRKIIFSVLVFFLATTFHISSFVAILFPLVSHIKFNKKWVIAAISAIIITPTVFFALPNLTFYVSLLLNSQSYNVIGNYVVQEYNSSLNINAYIIHFIQYLIVIFAYVILKKWNKDRYSGFVLIYMTFMYMSTISYGFYRFTNYFTVFYILFMSDFIACLCAKYRIIRSVPIISLTVVFLYLAYYHENKLFIYDQLNGEYCYERYFPYRSIFDDSL